MNNIALDEILLVINIVVDGVCAFMSVIEFRFSRDLSAALLVFLCIN